MAKARGRNSSDIAPPLRPALSPEARENQMAALAMDLVEQRLRDGTASSQETTHFLKLVSSKAVLERDRLREENKLLKAKTDLIESQKRTEELYDKAIKAMRRYAGQGDVWDDQDDEY